MATNDSGGLGMVFVLALAGAFVWATSGLLAGKRKSGMRVYKFPAKFPKEWDERTVELKVGRRYRFPLPQPDKGSYWTLEFTTDEGTQSHRQELDGGRGAVGWKARGGYVFEWITPTEDLTQTLVTLAQWTDGGYVQEVHRVTVRKR